MGFGRGLLLWLIGIPLPIIILLAIFMHHQSMSGKACPGLDPGWKPVLRKGRATTQEFRAHTI